MIQLFQQRDFGDKINATFTYLTQQFRSLSLALLYIAGPVALASGIMAGVIQSNILEFSRPSDEAAGSFRLIGLTSMIFSPVFWLMVLASVLANLMVALITYAHLKLYERTKGGPITVADVWTEVQPVLGRGLIISVLGSIITFIGFLFFFIPGIYVAVVFSLALAVTSFEGTDFGQTWDRCFRLIREKWWSTFGLLVVMGIIVGIIGLLFSMPSTIIGGLVAADLLPDLSRVWVVVANVISTVGQALLNSLVFLAVGFQYTNLVERQEGRGLLSAIDSIGTSPAQPRANDEGDF
ncbi:hypothetical protein DYU11_03920 [Fibrisoma montanum]|uniref:DUF7847 domain-containing protein n=1 Tax=Fibrisoma montanum TaxID=2305895 RepID=A0A418MJD8_9BACT|nr:hypothetical protein [Fibrisoma montanum]RIV27463.1 hypothetical protein DYU11_03920 [Fibrisoma montanum]